MKMRRIQSVINEIVEHINAAGYSLKELTMDDKGIRVVVDNGSDSSNYTINIIYDYFSRRFVAYPKYTLDFKYITEVKDEKEKRFVEDIEQIIRRWIKGEESSENTHEE